MERARVQELELALKRKRDSDMDVDGGGGGGGGDDDDDEDWDGRPAAKKGRTAPPPQQKPASTVCQSSHRWVFRVCALGVGNSPGR